MPLFMDICFDLSLAPYEVVTTSHITMPVIVTAIATRSISGQHHHCRFFYCLGREDFLTGGGHVVWFSNDFE
ncbi:hypothetical protein TSUD_302240 [Trifolium subterraneum]|uniref:Uncharacterized protein n=1 Tax=Trifolium subterraneum TaxID=3900 RepID=A0A2Z6NIE2_TRISU|nr:hypothetical protein TSUD_302240 [Trifolium subterraneum]